MYCLKLLVNFFYKNVFYEFFFFFSSRRRHTRWNCDWSSDVCSSDLVSEYYSLAQYQRAAYNAIDSIFSAGKLPLLVGGTGLYISAVVEGYQLVDVPPNDRLRDELESLPLPQLVEQLEKSDPEAASRVDKSNQRRLIRSLE